jgi:hypothetical protein
MARKQRSATCLSIQAKTPVAKRQAFPLLFTTACQILLPLTGSNAAPEKNHRAQSDQKQTLYQEWLSNGQKRPSQTQLYGHKPLTGLVKSSVKALQILGMDILTNSIMQ